MEWIFWFIIQLVGKFQILLYCKKNNNEKINEEIKLKKIQDHFLHSLK